MAQPPTALPRLLRLAVLPTVALAVYAAWVVIRWDGTSAQDALTFAVGLGFPLYAAASTAAAAQRGHGRPRRAWITITASLIALDFGSLAVLYHRFWQASVHPLYPPAAALGFIVFPWFACFGVLALPAGFSAGARLRILLDGTIVAVSLFVVAWVALLHEMYSATGIGGLDEWLSISSLVSWVVTVTVAVLILVRAPACWRKTLILLTIGFALLALAGGAFVYLRARGSDLFDNPLGFGGPTGLVVLGIAALSWRPDASETSNEPPVAPSALFSLWLPFIPLAIAGGLELSQFREGPAFDPGRAAITWLVTAVLGRQFLVVAENRRLFHSASQRALRDPLTGLANRVLFQDRLEHAIQLYHRDRRPVSVLSIDLDDFKLINDSLGHPAGDALLIQAAQRLSSCVRTGDTVARLGGDEFAVLIENAGENAHLIVYQIMEAFERPFDADGGVIFMRLSGGLAVAPLVDAELSAAALLKQADMAMYSAKRLGGGLQTFSSDVHMTEETSGSFGALETKRSHDGLVEVRLLSDLRQAIGKRTLTVLYQPKVDLQTTLTVGAEALIRWPHPVLGMVQPHQFLPLVRQHGLMRTFTDLVLDRALCDAAQWRRQGVAIPVAVNLFPPLVGDVNLPGRIFDALAKYELPGNSLIVEITEDLLLDNIDRTRQVLEALREKHIHIALDDFGSGYSALTYLRKLPIDEVKVDYDLIGHVLTDPRAEAIVQAVIDLSHALHVTTVAEGVENAETAAWLRGRGCEVAQGMLYSPPIAASALADLLAGQAARSI